MSKPSVVSLAALLGIKVRNTKEDDLGKIKDFVVDKATSRIVYAVLSFGGLLHMGERLQSKSVGGRLNRLNSSS